MGTEKNDFPKTYVITCAQAKGDKFQKGYPNNNLIEGIKKYCGEKNAEFLILPVAGRSIKERKLHKDLAEMDNIFSDGGGNLINKKLNSNIYISDMRVPPQNVDPSSGRGRFVQRDKTLIIAHPKQRFKAFPNSNFDLPKILIGTGAVTFPNYNKMDHRGDAAWRDHNYGFVVVEVVNDKIFHFRQVRSLQNGKFIDLGLEFNGMEKPKQADLEALVLGDLHWGDTDPAVHEVNYEMIEEFNPKRLIIHDLFNGHSVNHHNIGKLVTLVREVYQKGRNNLKKELEQCYEELYRLSQKMGDRDVVIVASNHNEFLNRYLEEVRLKDDPENAYFASELMPRMMKGEDPVRAGIEMIGKIPKNVRFLRRDEDYKVLGWQLGSHGDKGMNGSKRANMTSREFSNGKSITGHSHTPEILRETYVIGTSTYLNLPYTQGQASSWMNTNALLWNNGTVELVNIIHTGKNKCEWRLN